ncbi:adenylate/guanylate cyclase domain-containing protein [Roseiconus nitratireducens]|uniref:Adenylate/guanylate cyclase domain-containing protein n=1 Tax=Roseiconus nitratireducens TaxID=2605748 RepID=A0A5M6D0F9_9BACT|nr:adenylate/guanylate cyclase domain-containing protein [Roseiconus nitratireducens]KAA5540934.1 adenylate/guanylate cyclase domain-containing protein [Roseiconus nitratireducens]
MPDLIAQGPQNYHRWRREMPEPTTRHDIVIGRSDADWNVPWDGMISRAHVRLRAHPNERVEVNVVRTARNPVFYRGQHTSRFTLVPGEHFVIGNTTFTLAGRVGSAGRAPFGDAVEGEGVDVTESVFDHVALRRRHFRDVNSRIDVLTRLPDLIASSDSEQELLVRVTSVLLQSTPAAASVAIVSAAPLDQQPAADIQVLHYDHRGDALRGASISRRLVRRAIEKRESVLNVWSTGGAAPAGAAFTAREDVDWAFCVPLRTEACRGWAIYITGQLPELPNARLQPGDVSEQLQDDVKFAELVGTTVASLQQSRQLQRRQAAMRNFFAPVVLKALSSGDTDKVLEPRESDLTVMFCDLRGFSRRSERDAGQLLQLLSDVSDALGVMTKHILGYDGVIGDFHGDAAMGFWGWPLAQADTARRATDAALAIRSEYHQSDLGFRCGIGIAHGPAVAGRIGTTDQVKVTAFGPVVNLASRLESMTKMFGAEIIIDTSTRKLLQQASDVPSGDAIRCRRLARVRPAGFEAAFEIHELLPPLAGNANDVTAILIGEYEAALDEFARGGDSQAIARLKKLPTWDTPSQRLMRLIKNGDHASGIINLPK